MRNAKCQVDSGVKPTAIWNIRNMFPGEINQLHYLAVVWKYLDLPDSRRPMHSANSKFWLRRDNAPGLFLGFSLGHLVLVKGNFNTTIYKVILDNCMLPPLWQQFGEGPFLFQHACAPGHKSRSMV